MTRPLRIAFYGGSFDPPHNGHLAIASALLRQFDLDEFVFVPAYHAPHKKRLQPTPAYDRFAMLCLATQDENRISISRIEIEQPQKPYSVETMTRINEMLPRSEVFFVMGADSWMDILTWKNWQHLLEINDHIVVTRPGFKISSDHVTDAVRERIIDLRGNAATVETDPDQKNIYFTDAVQLEISSTDIRSQIRSGDEDWHDVVPLQVAKYIEKYEIYQ